MEIPATLRLFFNEQKARYGELFWFEQDGNKIIVMIEKLVQKSREILARENIKDIKIISFENDDSIGGFYSVEAEQIDVETRPGKEEYRSIMDKDLKNDFTDQTNDIFQNQIVRVFRPSGYQDYCVVAYHSFGKMAPRGPIGWIKNIEGLRKLTNSRINELLKPKTENLISFEEACKKFEDVKYRIGAGSIKNGFDCSGLVQRIFYETKGIWLPRKARWQQMVCESIELDDVRQGDLVFFNKTNSQENDGTDHVALVWEIQPGRLPIIFHAKKILGKVVFEDLNLAKWLNASGGWEIDSFGRVKSV